MEIYLDNAATTVIDPRVKEEIENVNSKKIAGNPSSIHIAGTRTARIIEKSRVLIAKKINANPEQIYFTSGGTEANNLAIQGVFFKNYGRKVHFISATIEHPSILKTLLHMQKLGAEVTFVSVNKDGVVSIDEIKNAIKENTVLISIMHANNEIGTIQPIKEIGEICSKKNILFHSDASQSFGKINIDVQKQNINLLTVSAHKNHGPKGVGALFVKDSSLLVPILHGGGQEGSMRSGTSNIDGILGMSKAIEISSYEEQEKIKILKNYLVNRLKEKFNNFHINGSQKNSLSNIVNIRFTGINARKLFLALNENGIYVSTSSACSAGNTSPSYVLNAMGLTNQEALESIRISFSRWTTREEIDQLIGFLETNIDEI